METIDYSSRAALVEAVIDARKRGVEVMVVGNGRTLKFPDDIEQLPPFDNEEKVALADDIVKTPVENDTLLGVVEPEPETQLDRSTFTVEGTCSACEQAAISDETGSWVHVEAATHGDNEGTFVPNEPVVEEPVVEEPVEDEDLIGTSAPQVSKSKRKSRGN